MVGLYGVVMGLLSLKGRADNGGFRALLRLGYLSKPGTVTYGCKKGDIDNLKCCNGYFRAPQKKPHFNVFVFFPQNTASDDMMMAVRVWGADHNAINSLVNLVLTGTDDQAATAVVLFEGDINAAGDDAVGKCTVLSAAAAMGQRRTVAALAGRGDVDPNKEDGTGTTPLCRASIPVNCKSMVEYLVRRFPSVNINHADGGAKRKRTALHTAAAAGSVLAVSELLAFGADTSATNSEGLTAAAVATKEGRAKVALMIKQVLCRVCARSCRICAHYEVTHAVSLMMPV